MEDGNKSFSAKKISFTGILLSLTVIVLFTASIVPTSKLSLYALSSFLISVVIMESGVKMGWLFYISSVLLSMIVVQSKVELIPYIAFFGNYGLIKFFIERIRNFIVEYVLKLLYFSMWLISAVLLFKTFFIENINVEFPWWLIILVFEIVFIVYDYVYTLFIRYYSTKLKKLLKR